MLCVRPACPQCFKLPVALFASCALTSPPPPFLPAPVCTPPNRLLACSLALRCVPCASPLCYAPLLCSASHLLLFAAVACIAFFPSNGLLSPLPSQRQQARAPCHAAAHASAAVGWDPLFSLLVPPHQAHDHTHRYHTDTGTALAPCARRLWARGPGYLLARNSHTRARCGPGPSPGLPAPM